MSPIHSEPPMAIDPERPDVEPFDPYAAPESLGRPEIEPEMIGGDAEILRLEHIQHEASVRSIGILLYLGTIAVAIFAFVTAVLIVVTEFYLDEGPNVDSIVPGIILIGIYAAFSAVFYVIGRGLRMLKEWARWIVMALDGIGLAGLAISAVLGSLDDPLVGLLALGVGGLIPGYILYVLAAPKAGVVFSPEYRWVVEATPHVKPRTSPLLWLILLVLLLTVAMTALVQVVQNR